MPNPTSESYTSSVPPGAQSEGETQRRMAFQSAHPEVGFRHLDGCEPPWVAYWAADDGNPRHLRAATLGGLLDDLKPLFDAP